MADLQRIIDQLVTSGAIKRIARNRAQQFGSRTRPRPGARILPAEDQPENSYTDDTVKYRTNVANAGTRYGPVQLKGNAYTGSVKVELFEYDIGSELTSKEYDTLLRYLDTRRTMDAVASITNFLDVTINQAIEDLREVYRWQAIELASVTRKGHNKYLEVVPYSNPSLHRAAAAAAWSNDATEIMDDISNRVQLLADKGFKVGQIFSSRNVVNIMAGNAKMATRAGKVKVSASNGAFTTTPAGRLSLESINQAFSDEGLPPIQLLDGIYRTQTGTTRFISNNVMIFLALTGRDATVELGDTEGTVELLPDVLGYYGVGRAAGQSEPGRVIRATHEEDKPPRIEAQGWETGAPVITEPEAIATITGIA